MSKSKKLSTLFVFMTSLVSLAVNAADTSAKPDDGRTRRIEMLEKMAKAHKDAADCLKAGKSEEDCQKQMMENCPMREDAGSCPMMEGGMNMMMGRGMRHGMGPGSGRGRGPKVPAESGKSN